MNKETIFIQSDYIQLGQLLKLANIVESGGMVKPFLADCDVFINGEQDQRRGRKLYTGDVVEIPEVGIFEIAQETK
ncbi:hypothetical protein Pryu01_01599 [Paraliobacillus ryukyuensis]|uniref:S4 domain protein YaaA n=1 Tax=Paraliobacillus ryukyuensis TaxID=200904 RepID=A0A366EC78_9BACI|nr:S4 domain-containing protein YaaA [Paraliobacillus ryukyuensis]RBO99942.1 S4 domain protein YaaA [Paraliobacillus ryukyuensis]